MSPAAIQVGRLTVLRHVPELYAVVAAASRKEATVRRPVDAPDDAAVGLGHLAQEPDRRLAYAVAHNDGSRVCSEVFGDERHLSSRVLSHFGKHHNALLAGHERRL